MATLTAARNSHHHQHHHHHHQHHHSQQNNASANTLLAMTAAGADKAQNAFRPKLPQVWNNHNNNNNNNGRPGPMTMTTTPAIAPFVPQTTTTTTAVTATSLLGKRSFAQISPTMTSQPPASATPTPTPLFLTQTPTASSALKPGHFCLVELLHAKDDTTTTSTTTATMDNHNHNDSNNNNNNSKYYPNLWWPCLVFETNEAHGIFQDLYLALQTNRLKHEHLYHMMAALRAGLIDPTKINLAASPVVNSKDNDNHNHNHNHHNHHNHHKPKSLVTLLLGEELPAGYKRSYFDNAARTTSATGRGRRVFMVAKGTEWQEIVLDHLIANHVVVVGPNSASSPSLVQTALEHNQLLLQRFVEMKPSSSPLEYDASEVDLLALGDQMLLLKQQQQQQEKEEESPSFEMEQDNHDDDDDEYDETAMQQEPPMDDNGSPIAEPQGASQLKLPPQQTTHDEESTKTRSKSASTNAPRATVAASANESTTTTATTTNATATKTKPKGRSGRPRKNKNRNVDPPSDDMEFRSEEEEEGTAAAAVNSSKKKQKTGRRRRGRGRSSFQSQLNPDTPSDLVKFKHIGGEAKRQQTKRRGKATPIRPPRREGIQVRGTTSEQESDGGDTHSLVEDTTAAATTTTNEKEKESNNGNGNGTTTIVQEETTKADESDANSSESGTTATTTTTVETKNGRALSKTDMAEVHEEEEIPINREQTNAMTTATATTTTTTTTNKSKSHKTTKGKKSPKNSVKKSNYEDMETHVYIPTWATVRPILLACGYEFGKLLPNSQTKVYARPFGAPRQFPSAKLGENYFTDMASFRAHLCAHGVDYIAAPPTAKEQSIVNHWCRFSIASEFAKPNANSPDFKLHHYIMEQRKGHNLLHKKLGFKYKDKCLHRGYQWPGETKDDQLMEDQDMWSRLAKFGLPKGLPLEKLKDDNEVLALLLCIVDVDIDKRSPVFIERKAPPPPRDEDGATENDNGAVDEMETDSAEANEMVRSHPNVDEVVASDQQQEAVATSEMDMDIDDDPSKSVNNATAQEQPKTGPSSPSCPQVNTIPASQPVAIDSEAIASCHRAPEAVSPIEARQNLGSSFAKVQASPASNGGVGTQTKTGPVEIVNEKSQETENGSDTVPTADLGCVAEFFGDTTDEESVAIPGSNCNTPEKQEESSTVESWITVKSPEEVAIPGTTAGEKLQGCLEALKSKHDDRLVVGSSLATSLDKIDAFLKDVIDSRGLLPNAYLHVCGGPGVGKTAGINACVKKMQKYWSAQACKSIEKSHLDKPNFLILKGSEFQNLSKADAMAKTFEQIGKKVLVKTLRKPADLEGSKKAAVILVLDEVDMLISKQGTEEYLREVIGHASDESMMLGMIGISNSIENAGFNKLGFSGQRIVFGTYDKEDLVDMITSKIGNEVVDEKVLTFLASKISGTSGDIRSMLGIVASAVEACQAKLPTSKLEAPLTGPIVRMPHALIAAKALTTKVKEVIDSLPKYERYVLCCGVNLSEALMGHELTLERFHSLFTFAFGFDLQLTVEEFTDVLDRLADKDLLRYDRGNAKGPFRSRTKIRLDLQLDDVVTALNSGLQKEDFFKKMNQRCGEIARSVARNVKHS